MYSGLHDLFAALPEVVPVCQGADTAAMLMRFTPGVGGILDGIQVVDQALFPMAKPRRLPGNGLEKVWVISTLS